MVHPIDPGLHASELGLGGAGLVALLPGVEEGREGEKMFGSCDEKGQLGLERKKKASEKNKNTI